MITFKLLIKEHNALAPCLKMHFIVTLQTVTTTPPILPMVQLNLAIQPLLILLLG